MDCLVTVLRVTKRKNKYKRNQEGCNIMSGNVQLQFHYSCADVEKNYGSSEN